MTTGKKSKKFFSVLVFSAAAANLAGCSEDPELAAALATLNTDVQTLVERYDASPRLQDIITSLRHDRLGHDCLVDRKGMLNGCEYEMPDIVARHEFLVKNDIALELSTTLPQGAVVQIFKDRIPLNAKLPPHVQKIAFVHAVDYMLAQIRDGIEYGTGESFALGEGELMPLSKTGDHERVLVPVPVQEP